jgi:hypothetical protein
MKPRLLILLAMVVVLVMCTGPVAGLRENFQHYTDDGQLQYMHNNVADTISPAYNPIWVFGDNNGTVYINRSSEISYPLADRNHMSTGSPSIYTYAAYDLVWCNPGSHYIQFDLIDTSFADFSTITSPNPSCVKDTRVEMKIIGGTPTVFKNGVQVNTVAVVSVNPSYLGITAGELTVGRKPIGIDNLVIGESDHHIVGALPSNWSIQRDLLNPSATGVYAQHPVTGAWAVKDSYYFYIDADKEYLLPENVVIKEYMTGTVVNTTTVSGTGNRIKYSISQFLNNPTSLGTTLPDGKYTVSFESSPLIYDDFWVISSGAVMSFNKVQYATSESAYVTYTISPTYFTSDYTYKMDMQDVYGNVIESQALTAASGTKTFSLNPTSYPAGVYYGVIRATKISDGSVSIMAYSGMETVAYILWNGYVMNAENGSVISGAYVNVTQLGTTVQSQSLSSGAWNSSNNWIPSSQFNITTMKTGYTTDVRLLTPLGTTGINLNLSLVPLPPLNISTSIGGIVRDNVYGNPIPNATVSGVNNTLTRTNLTNIAGYYRVDNMLLPDVVNMSAAKTGYVNDTVLGFLDASVATSFTRKDLILDPVFSFTLNIVDSATSMPIPVVGVLDSLGNNQTTTTGVYTASYPYSSVILYLSSSGYDSKSVSYIIDSDRTETVELSEAVEIPGVQPQAYPKYVTFHVKDGSMFGQPLAEVGINVTGISTSSGDWDWVSQLIGVPLNEVPINTAHMYQSTDSLGRATFYVIPTAKYNITFTKVGYTIPPMILVPQDDDYIVTATSAISPFYRSGVDEISAINVTVTSTLYNESWAFLNFSYYDSTGHTTGGTVRVLQKSDTAWVADSVMASWPVTSSSFSNSTVVVHVQQVSGYIDANITHSDFGTIVRSYPYSFNSVPVQFLGFGSDITLIVALGIMLFTMMLGGAAHGRILLVIVSAEGWIMYTMHWFQSLFDRGVPETAFISALVFMFIIGILANILMRKKRGL